MKRDLGLINLHMEQEDIQFSDKQLHRINIICELLIQQEYMYRKNTHSVKNRIVSISPPYICPIICSKAKSLIECGEKLDMSIDETGFAQLESLSFDTYNESDVLIEAIESFNQRTGHYPERVLVDQIYRNRNNRVYFREEGTLEFIRYL